MGPVQKKTALLLGGGLVVIGGIVWYRQKQTANSPDAAATGETAINPATGYAYGSAEDAAALAAQAAYISPSSSGGSSTYPTSNTGYSSNGQWTQAVVEYMISNNLVEDSAQLSTALGKYITGAYATDTQVALIQQAIAVQGFPPISGTTGYPPSINRTPPTTESPVIAPTGFKVLRADQGGASLDWNPTPGAKGYKVFINGAQYGNSVVYSTAYVLLPKRKTKYTVGVAGIFTGDKVGPMATTSVTTK
jgi:hypothetical protein